MHCQVQDVHAMLWMRACGVVNLLQRNLNTYGFDTRYPTMILSNLLKHTQHDEQNAEKLRRSSSSSSRDRPNLILASSPCHPYSKQSGTNVIVHELIHVNYIHGHTLRHSTIARSTETFSALTHIFRFT